MQDQLRQQLDNSFVLAQADVNQKAKWYEEKKKAQSKWSRTIRFLSITLIGLGGIFPLIGKFTINEKLSGDVTNWGYITIAIAGTMLFLDRFFGFSSSWVRYVTTELEIRKLLKEFEFKWQIEISKIDLCKVDFTCDKMIQLLTMLKDFSSSIDELVKQETNNWATEFQSNIAELQKIANSKLEELKPGSIKVVVKNILKYQKIVIKVDSIERKVLIGTEALIENITTGPHTVIAEGELLAGDNKGQATTIVTVETNKMAIAELMMP